MLSYEPRSPPVAATIAGSDSGGGAGIQADLKTMAAQGVFGTSIVTAVTAQNTGGVEGSYPLDPEQVRAQYKAVIDDFDVGAIKTGMLATAPIVKTVTESIRSFEGPVVVDPVMIAATGDRLLSEAAEDAYGELIAESTLVTPNADEAAALTGMSIETTADAAAAGRALVDRGADAALVKGGHIDGETVVDTLVRRAHAEITVDRFEHERVDTDATHGSGCTLSSAIAARLASGDDLGSAVEASVAFMGRAVRYGVDVGSGPGAVNPLVDIGQ